MSTAPLNDSNYVAFDKHAYNEQISYLIKDYQKKFVRICSVYTLWHLFFITIATVELFLLLIYLPDLFHSTAVSITIAIFTFTIFTYGMMRLYCQARKPEKICDLHDDFMHKSKVLIQYQRGVIEHHLSVGISARKFATELQGKEYSFHNIPESIQGLVPTLQKISCWWYWSDVHLFKKLLLESCIEEHIELVKCEPTNLEVHAALANAYILLSSLYSNPKEREDHDEDKWYPEECFSEAFSRHFRLTAQKAIEEFKILSDYAPNDPWVHFQLAYSYHDLQMPDDEIKQYEIILRLQPSDKDALYKLGTLYFQRGLNSKGLQVYEELKLCNYKQAETLLTYYGSAQSKGSSWE